MSARTELKCLQTIRWIVFAAILCLYSLPLTAQSQMESGSAQTGKGNRQQVVTSWEGGEKYELRLNSPVRPNRIAGTYTRAGKGVRFRSTKTSERLTFTITTLDGRELYRLTQDKEYIRSNILGGRLRQTFDLEFLEVARDEKRRGVEALEFIGTSVEGDVTVADEYWSTPELALLPHLSKLIGQELGYTGAAYPATLPLHLMALSVDKHAKASGSALSEPLTSSPNEATTCQAYPFRSNGCYGMCGPGCTCWKWLCGDCCFHTGCAVHDDYCRTWMGFGHPYCNIYWYIPFYIGGGC